MKIKVFVVFSAVFILTSKYDDAFSKSFFKNGYDDNGIYTDSRLNDSRILSNRAFNTFGPSSQRLRYLKTRNIELKKNIAKKERTKEKGENKFADYGDTYYRKNKSKGKIISYSPSVSSPVISQSVVGQNVVSSPIINQASLSQRVLKARANPVRADGTIASGYTGNSYEYVEDNTTYSSSTIEPVYVDTIQEQKFIPSTNSSPVSYTNTGSYNTGSRKVISSPVISSQDYVEYKEDSSPKYIATNVEPVIRQEVVTDKDIELQSSVTKVLMNSKPVRDFSQNQVISQKSEVYLPELQINSKPSFEISKPAKKYIKENEGFVVTKLDEKVLKNETSNNVITEVNSGTNTVVTQKIEPSITVQNTKNSVVNNAKLSSKYSFIAPLQGQLINKFGTKKDGSFNDGISISANFGEDIIASDKGSVIYSGNQLKGYGNLVIIRHSNGHLTSYAHLKNLQLKKGQKVSKGQVIGQVGVNEKTSQPELHFSIRKGRNPVDPLNYITI